MPHISINSRRLFLIPCLAAALWAGGCLFRSEPLDAQVLRLLKELQGAPVSQFGWAPSPRSHAEIFADFDRLGPAAVPELIAIVIEHPSASTRVLAILQLERLRDRRAAPPLIGSLADRGPGVDVAAASALGALNDPAAFVPLIDCLSSHQPNLRACAASALGKLKDRRAAPALISVIADPDLTVRACAVEALGRLGDPRAIAPLIAALEQDESPWVRDLAIHGLVRLGRAECISALARACQDDSPRVREDAHLALSLIAAAQACP